MGAVLDRGGASARAARRGAVSETAPARPHHADIPAWRSRSGWAILLIVTVLALAGDLASKWAAFRTIAPDPVVITKPEVLSADQLGYLIPAHDVVTVVPHGLELTLVLNEGAVFGMAAGQTWFFVAFTVVALGFCCWMFASWTHARDRVAHVAIALVLAGGLGNLYDRLMFACVRDFLHFLPGVHLPFGLAWPGGETEVWPYVSNVADAELIVGIALLIWFSLRAPAHAKADDERKPDGTSDASAA